MGTATNGMQEAEGGHGGTEVIPAIASAGILPALVLEKPTVAVEVAESLIAGGITVAEVMMRRSGALSAIEAVRSCCMNMLVGAGTVLNEKDAADALSAGAHFIVSPGFDQRTVEFCIERDTVVIPGVLTPTELQLACNHGLEVIKVFPADVSGGPRLIKDLSGPFPMVRFLPTGGINEKNLGGYLAIGSVLAVSGTWITHRDVIAARDFDEITRRAVESVRLVKQARGGQASD
ncbi:MAG: bifunctional 4-hydroxy-2-oxoglutarate aldolase/2-dehydro-3-deoxy-phosphogluconate aldolase [Actinobacteria bacterium]|nr:bifunctional 4-hydroxy-2-oxoglutarate aldolase/2-dehydro-3-deoxy-phosphogluconate aldolase [Actinomycetota bacterium]MCL5447403.1 bifunctional 4-hydroxy-2-oxoglutarate aldolase/2-dehydro-3-deoxy-phosphogluconate aldolase [Actinomycetota bacterium]